MKAKITLFVLIASLLGGSYWHYDINKYTMPKTIEVTPWAKGKVQEQLSRVNKPITLEDIKKAYDFFANSKPVIYFSIRKGTVKITTPNASLRKITYFKVLNYVIENFAKKELLKDNDFLIALSDDGDSLTLPPELSHVPVFVFAKNKSKESNVIRLLIVDPFTLKSWCEIYKTLEKGLKEYPWDKKINKLFWRGKTSDSVDVTEIRLNSPRVSLVKLTKQFPDRYDARLTKILSTGAAQIKQVKELCGEPVAFASTKEHLPFKYQITLDGVTATYPGYLWRMGSGCVNIKQDSVNEQWFYELFKPNVHYLPVATDLSNLDVTLIAAKTHDVEMKEMAMRARQVVEQELTPSKVFGYLVELLNGYATKLKTL
ncbi:MAG: glycosyl transferase family 90 [Pseudomonadota bacterium]|jgi:hypothetical protein|nr:glycosyl transferase family 90 [Pseudomonadota bacterium]